MDSYPIHGIDILCVLSPRGLTFPPQVSFFVFPGIHHTEGVYFIQLLLCVGCCARPVFTPATTQKDLG